MHVCDLVRGVAAAALGRYKQMIGRAGRAGHADQGDSYLLCESSDGREVEAMLRASMPRVESCLLFPARMKRLLLEGLGSGLVRTVDQVELYLQATLLWHAVEYAELHAQAKVCIEELVADGVIEWSATDQEFRPTTLGVAASVAGVDSKEAKQTHRLLSQAIERGLSLSCNIDPSSKAFSGVHLLFIAIPLSWTDSTIENANVPPIDYVRFYQRFCQLNDIGVKAAQLCGIEEGRLAVAAQTRRLQKAEDPEPYVRFWLALLLRDLIAEKNRPDAIAAEARITVVRLEFLREDTCNRAASLSQFCGSLAESAADAAAAAAAALRSRGRSGGGAVGGGGWPHLSGLLGRFSLEIQPMDGRIADSKLLEVEAMADWQARALWAAGVSSPAQLSQMPAQHVTRLLNGTKRRGTRNYPDIAKRLVEKAKICAARLKREEIASAMADIPEALRGGATAAATATASGGGGVGGQTMAPAG